MENKVICQKFVFILPAFIIECKKQKKNRKVRCLRPCKRNFPYDKSYNMVKRKCGHHVGYMSMRQQLIVTNNQKT